jgi:hypothetical protein
MALVGLTDMSGISQTVVAGVPPVRPGYAQISLSLFEHDLLGRAVSICPNHALGEFIAPARQR